LCNGSNGTPDLRNRFVVGAGGNYSVNATGGSADAIVVSHSHSDGNYSADSVGNHTHDHGNYGTNNNGAHVHTYVDQQAHNEGYRPWKAGDNDCGARTGNTGGAGEHSHSVTGDSGGGGSHSHGISGNSGTTGNSGTNANLPPYYALCYIMKT
jgi:hypothetical protein